MKSVDLPLVPLATPLRLSLTTMRERQRGAVIAADGSILWLFTAKAVVHGLAQGKQMLDELARRLQVRTLSDAEAAAFNIQLDTQLQMEPKLHQLLHTFGINYVHAPGPASDPAMTQIITRSELFADGLDRGPADCYCTHAPLADNPHEYDAAAVPRDGKCIYDGSAIVCYP